MLHDRTQIFFLKMFVDSVEHILEGRLSVILYRLINGLPVCI